MGIYDNTIPKELLRRASELDPEYFVPSAGLLALRTHRKPRDLGVKHDHTYHVSVKNRYVDAPECVQTCYNVIRNGVCYNVAYRMYPDWSMLYILAEPRIDGVHHCPNKLDLIVEPWE